MKRHLLSLALIFTIVSCSKKKEVVVPEAPSITKTIEFKIVPSSDFTQPQYNGSTAEIKLQVYKQFDNPFSTQMIWDTVISRQALGNFTANRIITKSVTGIKESECRIGVGYSISYITAPMNYTTWSAMGEVTPYGNVTHKVQVGL